MRQIRMMILVAVVLICGGCTQTTVQNEWRDPGFQGARVESVIVLALPPDADGKVCMDEFVKQLEKRKVSAVPVYRTAAAATATKEEFLAKARELGYRMALVSRFLDTRSELGIYPRSTPSMILAPGWDVWPTTEYVENDYLIFSTTLYDTAQKKAIWSAVSDTYVKRSDRKTVESYVKAILKKMEKQGLVGKD